MIVYCLKTCDTCRKALKWLNAQNIAHETKDIRGDGIDEADLTQAIKTLGWETVLNRRSTTWRGLDDAQKTDMTDAKAVALIMQHPTLMKRPLFILQDDFLVGFTDAVKDHLTNMP